MKYYVLIYLMFSTPWSKGQSMSSEMNFIKVSQSLLYAIRTGDSSEIFIHQLSVADKEQLSRELMSDTHRKAFWLNIYNAFVQKLLADNTEKYQSRNSFFTDKQITIADKPLSLDDIEHGILRRSKVRWGRGYLQKFFPSEYERNFRVAKLDYRIHFALNCGAKSCPPITFYDPDKIDLQLNLATRNYLHSEVEKDEKMNVVRVPKIMSWYRADFGGKKGIVEILRKHELVSGTANPKIKFKPYNWDLYLHHYSNE